MLGELDLFEGAADEAAAKLAESLAFYTEIGANLDRAACLTALAGVAALRGLTEEAERLFREADELRAGAPLEAPELAVMARFGAASGNRH